MPELPEVQTVINDLHERILEKRILKVDVRLPRIVRGAVKEFKNELVNSRFESVERLGKLIVFKLKNQDKWLLVHLKMTGQLIYRRGRQLIAGGHSDSSDPGEAPNKWTRAVFEFSDNSKLYFNDLRTFGYLEIAGSDRLREAEKTYGYDALTGRYTQEEFKRLVKARKTSIKALLLNQQVIAGLGNIYVDEILFMAGVRPQRRANSLKIREIEAIRKNIKPVLRKAVKNRGTTFNNFVDTSGQSGRHIERLMVYGRHNQQCRRCGKAVKKIKTAGRGTHFCPGCQI